MNVLEHPELKDLAPLTEREGLLYLKAYFEAIEATLGAVRQFGVDAVEDLHRRIEARLIDRANQIEQRRPKQ